MGLTCVVVIMFNFALLFGGLVLAFIRKSEAKAEIGCSKYTYLLHLQICFR